MSKTLIHPYVAGDKVKALWFDPFYGTCLVTADVVETRVDASREAPYGITVRHGGKTRAVWVRANGTDIHDYIYPAKG